MNTLKNGTGLVFVKAVKVVVIKPKEKNQ